MSAAEVRGLERQAAELRPQIAAVLAGLEAVAAGRVPESYPVTRTLLDKGVIVRNPARHGVARSELLEGDRGTAVCTCGAVFGPLEARHDIDGERYDGELWAQAAVDVHAAEANAGMPVYVFTPEGERFARQAGRFGMPGGAR